MENSRTLKEAVAVWWLAGRPFSFPASVIPVTLGTVAAVVTGGAAFSPFVFIACLAGIVLLHAASNMLNDVFDYKLGIDTTIFPESGAVVRHLLTPAHALRGALVYCLLGSALGLWVAFQSTLDIIWIGFLGVATGIGYSLTARGLKYRGYGDFCVFFAFGILGTLGGWTAQAGSTSWLPVLWAIPVGLLIIAILHANNWRDIGGDIAAGSSSVASTLGDRLSMVYYVALLFVPFLLVLVFTFAGRISPSFTSMPEGSLVSFVSVPMACQLVSKGRRRWENRQQFLGLDGYTARFNMVFGILLVVGFVLSALLK